MAVVEWNRTLRLVPSFMLIFSCHISFAVLFFVSGIVYAMKPLWLPLQAIVVILFSGMVFHVMQVIHFGVFDYELILLIVHFSMSALSLAFCITAALFARQKRQNDMTKPTIVIHQETVTRRLENQ
jgi:hypothetical protein